MNLASDMLRRFGLSISPPEGFQMASRPLLRQALESWDILEQQKNAIRELQAGQTSARFIAYNAKQGARADRP